MPEELDAQEQQAREEGWLDRFDRLERLQQWREQGWPGPLSPENARIMHVGRQWFIFDDLELACQITGFSVPQHLAESTMTRLGMAYQHYREAAKKEA